ncbi:MAG: hypothetical protein RQ885_15870 [Desulfurococcales archaeon]|nr:hypothetical protein [Desulfurococcales archaeon]
MGLGGHASGILLLDILPALLPAKTQSLKAFRKLVEKRSRWRTNRVALFPNRYEEEVLFDIGLACARLWNEINYEKRQASSRTSLQLRGGMRSTRDITTNIGRFLVLMPIRLLIRMMRLGMRSSSF